MKVHPSKLSKNEIKSCEAWTRKGRIDTFANYIRTKTTQRIGICVYSLLDELSKFIGNEQVQRAFQYAHPLVETAERSNASITPIEIESFLSQNIVATLGQYLQWCQHRRLQPTQWDYDLVAHVHREDSSKIFGTNLACYYLLHLWTNMEIDHNPNIHDVLKTKFTIRTDQTADTILGNLPFDKIETLAPRKLLSILNQKIDISRMNMFELEKMDLIKDSLSVLVTASIGDIKKYNYTEEDLYKIYTRYHERINIPHMLWAKYIQNPMDENIFNYHWSSLLCLREKLDQRPPYLRDNEMYISFENKLEKHLQSAHHKEWQIWSVCHSVGEKNAFLRTLEVSATNINALSCHDLDILGDHP